MLKSYYKPVPPLHSDVAYSQTVYREVPVEGSADPDETQLVSDVRTIEPFKSPNKKQLLASDVTLKKQLKAKVKLEPVSSVILEPDVNQAMEDFSNLLN